MKRVVALFIMLACCCATYSQIPNEQSGPIKLWTSSFSAIDVDANIILTLTSIPDDQAPYIVYDTKGNPPANLSMEVDRHGVLHIVERRSSKNMVLTEIEIYFNDISDITLSKANTTVKHGIKTKMLDINLDDGARLKAELNVVDLVITLQRDSFAELSGISQYHTATISHSQYNASDLWSLSTRVFSRRGSNAQVDADTRLEAHTASGGVVSYLSDPEVLRTYKSVFGGSISPIVK